MSRAGVAVTLTDTIRISIFRRKTTSIDDILESEIRPSTENTTISMTSRGFLRTIAINDLFFTQSSQIVTSQEPLTFNATSGRESPASTYGTLVLNRSNSTIVSPVISSRSILRNLLETMIFGRREVSRSDRRHQNSGSEFFSGHIRELIDTVFSRSIFIFIQISNDIQIVSESFETLDFFNNIVEFLEISLELLEKILYLSGIVVSGVVLEHQIVNGHTHSE